MSPASPPDRITVAGPVPARDRGRLTVSDRAIERIASQVAGEIAGWHRERGGVLDLAQRFDLAHRLDAGRPPVRVRLTPEYVDLEIDITVRYPQSVRDVCARVRQRVVERIRQLAGVPVRRVDVSVARLAYDPAPVSIVAGTPDPGGDDRAPRTSGQEDTP